MKFARLLAPGLVLLLSVSCASADVDVTLHDVKTSIKLNLTGECTGSGTLTDDAGTTNWTKTQAGDCLVHVDWMGALIPTARVKEEAEKEADVGKIKKITLESIKVTVKNVELYDASNTLSTPPMIASFGAEADIASNTFYTIPDAANLTTLLASEISTTITAGPILDAVNTAINDDTKLDASAKVDLAITTTELTPLQATERNPLRLEFVHDFEVSGKVDVGAF